MPPPPDLLSTLIFLHILGGECTKKVDVESNLRGAFRITPKIIEILAKETIVRFKSDKKIDKFSLILTMIHLKI